MKDSKIIVRDQQGTKSAPIFQVADSTGRRSLFNCWVPELTSKL